MGSNHLSAVSFVYIWAVFSSIDAAYMDYSGHKVIRMVPKTQSHLKLLRVLRSTDNDLDFWTEPTSVGSNVDIRVQPEDLEELTNTLKEEDVEHTVFIEDVQELIDRQQSNDVMLNDETSTFIDFTKYHRIDKIHNTLHNLAAAYPDKVEVEIIGQSYEGRNLTIVKIGKKSDKCKPAIWIDAGIHAREWIAPATALYIIDQLTNNYESHSHLVDNLDWYIHPSVNPDGYEFTHTDERLWRKTRSLNYKRLCRGVDANRNFAFHFNGGGSSRYPCSEVYHGSHALSEPEAKAVADFLVEHSDQLKMYLSLHSYGQVILTPWAYSYTLPPDFDELFDLMANATKSMEGISEKEKYVIGSTSHLLYIASGSSTDYAKGVAGIKYSYTVELRDTGDHGFILPATEIIPTGREMFARFKYLGEAIISQNAGC